MSASWCDTKWRCKQINKKKTFFVTKIYFDCFGDVCVGNVSITHSGSFALFSFFGESKWKWKWLSSQCGSALGIEIHIFFSDLRLFMGFLEYFDLLSSVYNLYIVWFFIFCVSSTLKNVLGNVLPSSF